MVYLLEKFQYILSGLIILLVLGFYMVLGGPDASGGLMVPGVEEQSSTIVELPPEGETPTTPGSGNLRPARNHRRPVDRELVEVGRNLKKLKLSNVQTRKIEKKAFKVKPETYQYIQNRRNVMKELQNAASTILRDGNGNPSMLQLHGIEEGSLFQKFGIQEGDVLCLVDGDLAEFNPTNLTEHWQSASDMLDQLGNGRKISVTILRNGQPVHMEFGL